MMTFLSGLEDLVTNLPYFKLNCQAYKAPEKEYLREVSLLINYLKLQVSSCCCNHAQMRICHKLCQDRKVTVSILIQSRVKIGSVAHDLADDIKGQVPE
ncbi:hypothetical protein M7I_7230 [Glarea lozoyensis 74030]|uniref:Uncharacterized protein n=1 Tax=Glarea lozoyensis (strain ATCC 74030 / MF5533) TaxID=1104152 RepID=H0EWQ7_GLAL7|nr:hypothetical protein M7I_7230 [Glarea lozoyensis 74030]